MKFKIGDMVWLKSLEATKKNVGLDLHGFMMDEFNKWHQSKKLRVISYSKEKNKVRCEWEDYAGHRSWWYNIDDLILVTKHNPVLIDRWELK